MEWNEKVTRIFWRQQISKRLYICSQLALDLRPDKEGLSSFSSAVQSPSRKVPVAGGPPALHKP